MSGRIPLKQAVERYQSERGTYGNAYDWYRRSAQRDGYVSIAGVKLNAIKETQGWTVASRDVDEAIRRHREGIARTARVTEDYSRHVLHGNDGESVRITWGGYSLRGPFHFVWSDYERGTRRSDGTWVCNTCFEPASVAHDREECHTCSNWGSCGRDWTASSAKCALRESQ